MMLPFVDPTQPSRESSFAPDQLANRSEFPRPPKPWSGIMNDADLTREELLAELQDARSHMAQIHADLHRARQLIPVLLDSTPDGFLLLDPDDRILLLNSQAERLMRAGQPTTPLLGVSLWELFPDLLGTPVEREFRAAQNGQHEVAFEQFYSPLGRWFEVRAYPTPQGLAVYFRDITERKAAHDVLEQTDRVFRLVWEHGAAAMRLTDADGRMIQVNPAFCRLVGHPRSLLEGQFLDVIHAPAEQETVLRKYRESFQQRQADAKVETEVLLWNGQRVWLEATSSFLEAPDRPLLLLTIFRDITERKQAAEQRLALERKLFEAQKLESLGALAGGIAHDFNNLLVAMLGHAGLVLMELPADHPLRQPLERIEAAAQRAAELTRQMLAYSGKGRFVTRRLHLGDLVEEALPLLRITFQQRVSIAHENCEELPAIDADPVQLRQMLMNLVENAAEATSPDGGNVKLATSVVDLGRQELDAMLLGTELSPGVYVQLMVADNGCGMDQARLRRIFDPFFSTKSRGRGLGLAAVLGIARGHRAAIGVTSQPGKGTQICICFPAVLSPSALPAVPHLLADAVRNGVILVVDDDAEVRQVAQRMLERLGYAVVQAGAGQAGLDFFTAHRQHVLCTLLDLTMPVMSGQEVLRAIRRIEPRARVIVMSGYTASEAYGQLAGEAHVEFLPKPFTIEQLREVLARCSVGMGPRCRQPADQTPPPVLSGAGISSSSTAGLPSQ